MGRNYTSASILYVCRHIVRWPLSSRVKYCTPAITYTQVMRTCGVWFERLKKLQRGLNPEVGEGLRKSRLLRSTLSPPVRKFVANCDFCAISSSQTAKNMKSKSASFVLWLFDSENEGPMVVPKRRQQWSEVSEAFHYSYVWVLLYSMYLHCLHICP